MGRARLCPVFFLLEIDMFRQSCRYAKLELSALRERLEDRLRW